MNNKKEHSDKRSAKQGAEGVIAEPNKITGSTAYDFAAKNLTAYGGLLPVATMLEKLGFQQLIEETNRARNDGNEQSIPRDGNRAYADDGVLTTPVDVIVTVQGTLQH